MRNVKLGTIILFMAFMFAACESSDEMSKSTDGILQLGLVATGADGSVYRLPAGTDFYVVANAVNTYLYIDVDGQEEMKIVTMSTGGYRGYLNNPEGSGAPWTLIRTAPDGTESTVTAQLTTSFPYNFNIVEGEVTVVTLQFSVNSGEDIVFTVGQLGIAIDVDETSEPPTQGVYQADEYSEVSLYANTNSNELIGLHYSLMELDGADLSTAMNIEITSDWILMAAGEKACASGNVTLGANAGNHPLWEALRTEIGSASNYPVCIQTMDSGEAYITVVIVGNAHTATTQELIDILGTTDTYYFRGTIHGRTTEPLFAGSSLLLSKLSSPLTFDSAFTSFGVYTNDYSSYVRAEPLWTNATIQFQ
ncbi:MAG: hypothetical protein JXX29_11950 [Deltaproteobacteria bacterium]|nr:hypothetical protein [Deltaproteobacteria bacterium]MBN2672387.1 hypothetical protein [Deltaproteobacteria bacterium]